MTILAQDSFNRANENPLAAPWSTASAGGPAGLKLVSNAVTPITTATDSWMYYSGVTWPADQYVKVKVGTLNAGKWDAGPVARMSATGFNGYVLTFNDGSHLTLFKVVGGSFGSALSSISTTLGVGDIVELRATGTSTTTLKMYINGVQIGTDVVDSSSPLTSGNAAIGMFDGAITADDFEAGDFTAGPAGAAFDDTGYIPSPQSSPLTVTGW